MEKRFTLALVLSVILLLVVNVYLFPSREAAVDPTKDQQKETPSETPADVPKTTPEATPSTPNPTIQGSSGQGDPSTKPVNPPGSVRTLVLENDALAVTFTSLGASIVEAVLKKEFPDVEGREKGLNLKIVREVMPGIRPLLLVDESANGTWLDHVAWDMEVSGRTVTFFTRRVLAGEPERAIEYKKVFHLPDGDSHHLDITVGCREVNPKANTEYQHDFVLTASGGVFQEVGRTVGGTAASSLVYSEEKIQTVAIGKTKDGKVALSMDGPSRYVADTSSYFGAFLILTDFPAKRVTARVAGLAASDDQAESGYEPGKEPDAKVGRTYSSVSFRVTTSGDQWTTHEGLLYLGRIDARDVAADLEAKGEGLVSAVREVYDSHLGFFAWISKLILKLLHFFHGLVKNWGWAIVLMTLTVRLMLFPINRRSQGAMMQHTEAMKKIKPKLDKLKEKYKDEPQKLNQETFKTMKEEGVSMVPLGGCLPMFLQLPIFFGLFSALRAAPDIRLAPWYWVKDLSQPDRLIEFGTPVPNPFSFCCSPFGIEQPPFTHLNVLPILMMGAMMLNTMLMPKPEAPDPQVETQRKMMMFMPLLMGFMLYNYAAGLSLYILTSSLLGIVESRVIRKVWPVKGTDAHKEKLARVSGRPTDGGGSKKG